MLHFPCEPRNNKHQNNRHQHLCSLKRQILGLSNKKVVKCYYSYNWLTYLSCSSYYIHNNDVWLTSRQNFVAVNVYKLTNTTVVFVSSIWRWQTTFSSTCSTALYFLLPVWHGLLTGIHLNGLAAWLVRQRLEISILICDRLVLRIFQSCDKSFVFISQFATHQRWFTNQHHVLWPQWTSMNSLEWIP